MAKSSENSSSKLETALVFTAVTVVAISLITLFGVLIAGAAGVRQFPIFLVWIPEIGLPLGFIIIISLVAFSARNRKKAGK